MGECWIFFVFFGYGGEGDVVFVGGLGDFVDVISLVVFVVE